MVAVIVPCGVVVVVVVIVLHVVVVAAVAPHVVSRSQSLHHVVLQSWTHGGCHHTVWCCSCSHHYHVLMATSP